MPDLDPADLKSLIPQGVLEYLQAGSILAAIPAFVESLEKDVVGLGHDPEFHRIVTQRSVRVAGERGQKWV